MALMNFSSIKHLIHERLISTEQSYQYSLLVKVGVAADVWRTWYIELPDRMVAVTYPILQQWTQQEDISIPDLEAAAAENDGNEYTIRSMSDVLGFLHDPELPEMYVVSKESGPFGAIAVLNSAVQHKLHDIFPRGYYVLPSSVHEILAVATDMADADQLAYMVRSINRDQVSIEDRLSDHVFTVDHGCLAVAV